MIRNIFLIVFVALVGSSMSIESEEKKRTQSYIKRYARLAVHEMHRSGIPASVILAQGIHESNSGQSRLAKEAKNHFGIKCKTYWKGKKFYHKDDDRNKEGALIASCFRSYDQVSDSYEDHTEFLIHSSYYQRLFHHPKTDYRSWANGLKECGYATDPAYTKKLIRLIESYHLTTFDHIKNSDPKEVGTILDMNKTNRMLLPKNYQRSRFMND